MWESDRKKSAYNLMPHTVGPGPAMPIAEFPHNFIIRLSFRSDPAVLAALLPEPLVVMGEPIITFMYRHSENVAWVGGGELNAMGATIAAQLPGQDDATGAYWPFLWENDAMAVILGREVFGAAKLYADISNPHQTDGVWRARLSERGRSLMDLSFTPKRSASEPELAAIQRQSSQARVLGWKHIPSPDMQRADLSYATLFDSPNQIDSAVFGHGEVVVYPGDTNVSFWTAHVVERLRSIPLFELVNAVLSRGSGKHHISSGKRLT